MDRRYSIQPILAKEKEEDKDKPQDTTRRGRTVPNFGKIRKWVKRSNVPRDLSKPEQEARGSWDEGMRRRDSETGLRGIVLRKGLSDDSKAFPLVKAEPRRASRAESSLVASGKRLCKWETVNLLRGKKQSDKKEEEKRSPKSRSSGNKSLEVDSSTGEEAERDVSLPLHASEAAGISRGESLESLSETEERLDSTGGHLVTNIPQRETAGDKTKSHFRGDRRPRSWRFGSSKSSSRNKAAEQPSPNKDSVAIKGRKHECRFTDNSDIDDYETSDPPRGEATSAEMFGSIRAFTASPSYPDSSTERRPSIIPTFNITNDQSNLERFLDSIGTTCVGSILEEPDENFMARAKSCDNLHQRHTDSMSIWERRKRATRDFSPGTRPIILNMEAIDDSVFCTRSVSNTLVEISSRAETFICKDDLHLGTRNITFSASSKGSTSSVGSGAAGGEGAGGRTGGCKLKKPTNLWGVSRRISVRRRNVVKDEKTEEKTENTDEPR
ncbi:unnamed protein product [Candidula unifasciata]|uniref:Uncharacterized protein n=1 Tax=Candidula unifasciata TaxID=100452 RepID=A0A8S3YIH9_9EUPU|nr:unnamed protein product [Candidula unifasciata]